MESRDTVYTFSFTVDWFHTVQEVAEISVPAAAARSRPQRTGTMLRSHRSAIRNQRAAETALPKAAKRLIRMAYSLASGSNPQAWAMMTKSGLPGGWGIPSTRAAAMYSEVSQNAVVGASVAR